MNIQPFSQTRNIETIFSYPHICHLSSGSVYFISQIVFRIFQFPRSHLPSLVYIYIYIYINFFWAIVLILNTLLNKVIISKHNANDVNPHFRSYTCLCLPHLGSFYCLWCKCVCVCVWVCAQSCPTLYDPMDCSLPISSVHRVSQARSWSGLPFPPPGDLPDPAIEPTSPAFQADFYRKIWTSSKVTCRCDPSLFLKPYLVFCFYSSLNIYTSFFSLSWMCLVLSYYMIFPHVLEWKAL